MRFLEIGPFCLFKHVWPDRTTFIYTGRNPEMAQKTDGRQFHPLLLPGLRRELRLGTWDMVICHTPPEPPGYMYRGVRGVITTAARHWLHGQALVPYVVGGKHNCPIVMLDYHDEITIPSHAWGMLDRAVLYFKRELPLDHIKVFGPRTIETIHEPLVQRTLPKLRPIPTALPDAIAESAARLDEPKHMDIFYAGTVNSSLRMRGLDELRALSQSGYKVDICEEPLPRSEYLRRMARAWLCWSPEGYGWDCFRHYEAAAVGSVPVLSPPTIWRHQPLRQGEHALIYRPEDGGLSACIIAALADKPRLTAMSRAAQAHVLAYNTHSRVAAYVLETVQTLLKGATAVNRERKAA